MSKILNFNNIKKATLTVTLSDEKNTVLMITTPTKAIMDDLINMKDSLDEVRNDENNAEAIDTLYSLCAKIMSRNKAGIRVDKKLLEEILDFEDIMVFFNAYMDFVSELADSKN